jgi:hypothetical protein
MTCKHFENFQEFGNGVPAIPTVAHTNLVSLKHPRSTAPPFFPVGSRPLIHTFPTPINSKMINANTRIAHAHPNLSNSGFKIKGNTIPPKLLPINTIPFALPLRTSNQ